MENILDWSCCDNFINFKLFHLNEKEKIFPLFCAYRIYLVYFVAFIPIISIFIENEQKEEESLYHKIEKDYNSFISAVQILVAMSSLMLIDSALDLFVTPTNAFGTTNNVINAFKLCILGALFIPNLVFFSLDFVNYEKHEHELIEAFICIFSIERYIFCCCLFLTLHHHDNKIWSNTRTNLLIVLQMIFTILQTIMNCFEYYKAINYTCTTITLLQGVIILFIGSQWVLKHKVALYEVFGFSQINATTGLANDEYIILGYIAASFFLAVGISIIDISIYFIYFQVAVATVLILFPGRVARRNAVQLDVKYLFYIFIYFIFFLNKYT